MRPVNIALIGAGARAIAFCKYFAANPQQAKLKYIVDLNKEKARFFNEQFNLAQNRKPGLIRKEAVNEFEPFTFCFKLKS